MAVRRVFISGLFLAMLCGLATGADNKDDRHTKSHPRYRRVLEGDCGCTGRWNCHCCVAIAPSMADMNQSLCCNWYIQPTKLKLGVNINWLNRTLFDTGISPDSAPPICVPLIPPVILAACIKVHNVTQHIVLSDNSGGDELVGACTNATLQTLVFKWLNVHLGCVRLTRTGLQLVRITAADNALLSNTKDVSPLSMLGG